MDHDHDPNSHQKRIDSSSLTQWLWYVIRVALSWLHPLESWHLATGCEDIPTESAMTHDYSTRSQKNSRNELKMFLVSKIKAPGGLVLKTIKVYIYCVGKQSLRVSLSKGGDLISALGRKMQVFMQNNKSTLRTEGVVFAFSIVSIWKRFTRARCTCWDTKHKVHLMKGWFMSQLDLYYNKTRHYRLLFLLNLEAI